VLAGLLGGNLWYLEKIHQAATAAPPPAPAPLPAGVPVAPIKAKPAQEGEDGRDRFARALYQLLAEKGGDVEFKDDRAAMLARYADLARQHRDLALSAENERGKLAVAAASVLAGRSADRVEDSVRRALTGKGYSDRLIQAACEQVREQLGGEVRNRSTVP
jgi:hypothetical protein